MRNRQAGPPSEASSSSSEKSIPSASSEGSRSKAARDGSNARDEKRGTASNGGSKGPKSPPYSVDVSALRRRARERMSEGAVTVGYRADPEEIVAMLNTALATELVCVLRYKRHQFTARGIHAEPVAAEFEAHAAEEQLHADRLAKRIVALGGEPDLSPEGLAARSHSEYDDSRDLISMIREDLVAERIAIESYTEMIRTIGEKDPTTRRLLEEILANEEEHADDLATLLASLAAREGG
jgi:bacterioferritin